MIIFFTRLFQGLVEKIYIKKKMLSIVLASMYFLTALECTE